MFGPARKNFWNGWRPDSVIDECRQIHIKGGGYADFAEWVTAMREQVPAYEKFTSQEEIIMVCYEAEAMTQQFEYYLDPYHVPYAAYKGDTSIWHKWQIAKLLDAIDQEYGPKPITILYFGDYEPIKETGSRGKGMKIPISAMNDIEVWFKQMQEKRGKREVTPLRLERIGLNKEHVEMWELPENPDPNKQGEYQWEALTDDHARELILTALNKHLNREAIDKVVEQEKADHSKWHRYLDEIIRKEDES